MTETLNDRARVLSGSRDVLDDTIVSRTTRQKRLDRTMLIFITAGASIPLLWKIGARSFWQDENATIGIVNLPSHSFWHVVTTHEANMGLYYVLLRAWRVFGTTETAYRSLSVVAALLAIPVIYWLAARLFGRLTATAAAVTLATNPFFLGYAHEARSYELAVLLTCASTLALVRVIQEGSTLSRWSVYTLLSSLAVYAHAMTLFVLVAHATVFLFKPYRDRRIAWFAASAGASAVLCTPLFLTMRANDVGQISWIPKPNWHDVWNAARDLTGASSALHPGRDLLPGLIAGGLALVAVTGLITFKHLDRRFRVSSIAIVLAWFVVPILISFEVSQKKPIFLTRYLIICVPAYALIVGAGLSRFRSRLLIVAGVVVFAGLSITIPDRVGLPQENWRRAAQFVASRAHPGDAIVFNAPWTRWGFEYYMKRDGLPLEKLNEVFPPPSWTVFGVDGTLPHIGMDTIARQAEEFPRIWVIARNWDGLPRDLINILKRQNRYVLHWSGGAQVALFERR